MVLPSLSLPFSLIHPARRFLAVSHPSLFQRLLPFWPILWLVRLSFAPSVIRFPSIYLSRSRHADWTGACESSRYPGGPPTGPPAAGKVSSFRAEQGGNPLLMLLRRRRCIPWQLVGPIQKSRDTPLSDNLRHRGVIKFPRISRMNLDRVS